MPSAVAEALAHVRLQVDRGQVAARARSRPRPGARSPARGRLAAASRTGYTNHERRCSASSASRAARRRRRRRAARRSGPRPPSEGEDLVELLDLGEPDGGGEVVEAVVVAEARVLEPAARVGAALVREALEQPPFLLGVDGDRAALARSSPACSGRRRRRPGARSEPIGRPRYSAPSASQASSMSASPCRSASSRSGFELARVAEDVDGDDRLRPRRDRRLDRGRVEVQRRAGRRRRTPASRPRRECSSPRRRTRTAR